ncbi:MAG: ABC transporter permease [Rhodobacteraceae bacterium]|nr:MAG: ABC transporter permease [Paracoccaceae bacterium]
MLWASPALLWQGAFFLAPLGLLVWLSFWSLRNFRLIPDFTTANWDRILTRDFFWAAFQHTLVISAVTALVASLIAFPVAYFLAFRARAATRRLAIFMLITPFFTSYLVRIYAWTIILANEGALNLLGRALGFETANLLSTPTATVIGYLTLCLPLVVLIQLFALSNVDRDLVGAAHNLGCGPLRTVLTVVLPAARTGLVIAAAFAFILAFGDYVSPVFLGGSRPPTLSILIVDQTRSGNHWPRAAVVAVVMILTLIAVLFGALAAAYGRRKGAA